jgi:hypothetical protein
VINGKERRVITPGDCARSLTYQQLVAMRILVQVALTMAIPII